MRRIALAGSLAAIALAGAAGYAVTALAGHPAAAPPAGLTTALDAEAAHGGTATGIDATGGDAMGTDGTAGDGTAGDGTAGAAGQQGGSPAGVAPGAAGTLDAADGTGAGTAGSAGTAGAGGCDENGWELRVQGAPIRFDGGDRAGDYLWHGRDGFHLRVTHRGDRRDVFAGYLHSDAPLALRPVRLEGRDAAWLSADRRTLGFRFYDYGHIDGVDFVTHCASRLTVAGLTVDGSPLPAGHVYLGHFRLHPAHVPFTIDRRHTV